MHVIFIWAQLQSVDHVGCVLAWFIVVAVAGVEVTTVLVHLCKLTHV